MNSWIKGRSDNISQLADEKERCLKEITDTKQNVIAHLNKLEIKLKDEVSILHGEHLQAIKETIQEFELLQTNVAKVQDEAKVVKQYASDFQSFMAFREFEGEVKSFEIDAHLLIKKKSAMQVSISFSPTTSEMSIKTLVTTLGNVNTTIKESAIKLVNHFVKQVQLLSTGNPCSDNIKLGNVFENVKLPSGNEHQLKILDSCFLSHGRLAFSDKLNKRLIVLKDNGEHDRDINLGFMPNAIAFITDNEIAVGKICSNKIHIVNMTSFSVYHSFEVTENNISTFSFRNEQFLVTVLHFGLCITDFEGNILIKIPFKNTNILFAVLLKDNIYFSQYSNNRIVCSDLKGNEIHEFNDKNLKAPLGEACSDSNVLFITGFKSKNIYALSSYDNEFKELYCNGDLSRARAIRYNSSKQQLLVSTDDGNTFLFNVIY